MGRFAAAPDGCRGQEGHKSDDVEPLPRDVLYVETSPDGSAPTIIVVGEFDMTGTEQFWAHVSEAVEARPVSLTIEARGLTFIDSSGLAAMVRAREAATEAGVAFRISEPSPPRLRIVEISGLESLLLHD
jgi:anti-anti-sigma factor